MSVNNPSSGSHPAVQLNLCAKIYVQRLSKVSSSRSDLSSELGLKSNHQFDSSTWRPDILRWPKSMSPFSLHKPTYNLLSLTPHQLHYFSCSGQNLRAMFVWIVFFFLELYLIPVPLLPHIPSISRRCLPSRYIQNLTTSSVSTNPSLIQAIRHLLPLLLDRLLLGVLASPLTLFYLFSVT